MTDRINKVAFVENVVPNYRLDYFRRLVKESDFEITVYYGSGAKIKALPTIDEVEGLQFRRVRAIGSERFFVIQLLPIWLILFRFDLVVFYSNPRYLTTLFLASVREIFRKPVILRNHWKTAGPERLSEKIRLWWTNKFRSLLVYTRDEVSQMRKSGFRQKHLEGWGNGLDSDAIAKVKLEWSEERVSSWKHQQDLQGQRLLVSVGRLIERNEFHRVLNVLPELLSRYQVVWCVVGDGPMGDSLRRETDLRGLTQNVRFLGSLHDEHSLAPIMLSADALVHPGTIGLSLIHALNYGVTVVTHSDQRYQNPEFCIAVDGENASLFERGSDASLLEACFRALDTADAFPTQTAYLEHRQRIAESVQENHSTKTMAGRSIAFFKEVLNNSPTLAMKPKN